MSTVDYDKLASRIRTYIDMVGKALEKAKRTFRGSSKELEVLKLAELYYEDSKYYFGIKDLPTSLSCIAYAEGLLDALRMLGIIEVEWVRRKPKKVLVGGTFDLIHVGHIYYLREAAKYGLVYAVVASDENVRKIKGREPILPQNQRLEIVSSIRYVYKAFVGHKEDPLKSVEFIKPDIILLGPDQPFDEGQMYRELEKRGLGGIVIKRLPKRIGNSLASSRGIIKEILRRFHVP